RRSSAYRPDPIPAAATRTGWGRRRERRETPAPSHGFEQTASVVSDVVPLGSHADQVVPAPWNWIRSRRAIRHRTTPAAQAGGINKQRPAPRSTYREWVAGSEGSVRSFPQGGVGGRERRSIS